MDPFDQPPVSPAVSFEPPRPPHRRPRPVLIGVAAALVVGAGVAGASQLAGADRSEAPAERAVAVADAPDPPDEAPPDDDHAPDPPDGDPAPEGDPAPDADPSAGDTPQHPTAPGEGSIVIDVGDGEPIVLELDEHEIGAIGECLGFDLAAGPVPGLDEWFERHRSDLDRWWEGHASELGELESRLAEVLGDDGFPLPPVVRTDRLDGHVTVVGPDGVTVIELGEGDGSVTITRSEGEIEITSAGDVTVHDPLGDLPEEWFELGDGMPPDLDRLLEEWFGELGEGVPPDLDRLLEEWFGELGEGVPPDLDRLLEEWSVEIDLPDPDQIAECLAAAGDGADG